MMEVDAFGILMLAKSSVIYFVTAPHQEKMYFSQYLSSFPSAGSCVLENKYEKRLYAYDTEKNFLLSP
jgi:hypothetical protein